MNRLKAPIAEHERILVDLKAHLDHWTTTHTQLGCNTWKRWTQHHSQQRPLISSIPPIPYGSLESASLLQHPLVQGQQQFTHTRSTTFIQDQQQCECYLTGRASFDVDTVTLTLSHLAFDVPTH
ncbi:unnamed protein product [Absidia cylindrospora]